MSHEYEQAVDAALRYHQAAARAASSYDHLVAGALAQQAAQLYWRAAETAAVWGGAKPGTDPDGYPASSECSFRASWKRCFWKAHEHAILAEAASVIEQAEEAQQ